LPFYRHFIQISLWQIYFIALLAGNTKIWVFFGTFVNKFKFLLQKTHLFVNRGFRRRTSEELAAQLSARFTFKMAVIRLRDHFFSQLLASKVLFFNHVSFKSKFKQYYCKRCLVQSGTRHFCFEKFLLLKKLLNFLDFCCQL
jgi:hypothetical protein